jgi:dTDP-4-amino-4,6-dideoxygalactose transaminase
VACARAEIPDFARLAGWRRIDTATGTAVAVLAVLEVRTHDAIGELAIFGGAPAFPEALHVGRPNLGDRRRLMARIERILDRRWLTNNGPFVQELEQRVCELVGVRHCIAVCNATVGLELVIRAAGLTGEVIVPSLTFVATAHALSWQQITPVFCDVEPGRYTLDPHAVEQAITPRTTGIIGVHLWGRPCDVDGLAAVADRHRLTLLFDAAHAFGCSAGGRPIGGFGRAEVFSFHATKFVNSFEGGAVVTDDGELAARVRLMKNFGFAGYDDVIYPGTNGKMPEVCAAMALTSLESLHEFVEVNRRHHAQYARELSGLRGVRVLPYDDRERANYQYVVLEIDPAAFGLTRDALLAVLHAENILVRRYFYPGCHRMEPYRSMPTRRVPLPETERLLDRVLLLPTGTAVDASDIATICRLIHVIAAHAAEVQRRWLAAAAPAADARHGSAAGARVWHASS